MATRVTCTALVLLSVALFVCLTVTPAQAQAVYGSIIGTVTDPQGAAVPNAKVTVTNVRKGTSDTATTNEQGNYSVTHLIPDTYDVSVGAQGFKTASNKGVIVSADSSARLDIALSLGATSEAVEVTAEAPQLKTDRADVATTFNERYVTELPILNRNFTTFELLSPGTQKLVGWNHASTENPQGSQQIFVNGQHFSGTGYELDGTDNQDPILGIIVVNPNLDAITETKIAFQNYDAEFGKAVAGIVTVQTKSGSNDLHGSGFWYRRTDGTSARDPFTQYAANPITGRFIPEDRWNQFGGTIGGPIIKNKLFFFGDYQGTRQASGITNQVTIPTARVKSTCIGPGDGSGFCKLDEYALQGVFNNGGSGLLYDPTTGGINAAGNPNTARTPFCGPAGCATQPNWIPLARIPSQVQKILALFPNPTNNQVQNNFIGSGSGPFSANQWDARVDWSASQSVQVFGRFSMSRFSLSGTGIYGGIGGVGNGLNGLSGSSITHNYSLATGFTKTFSNTLLTDVRFGWFRYNPTTHKPDEGTTPAKDVGIPNVNFGDLFTSGWPTFGGDGSNGAVGAVNQFGDGLNVGRCNCPLVEREQQFQVVNNWTKIHSNHTFKFGADIRYATNLRIPSDADRAGNFSFNAGTTANAVGTNAVGGNGFGTFMLGYVSSMNRFVSLSTDAQESQKRLFFYGQDTWRATQKLTLSLGLRWEIYTPESVNAKGNGGFANLDQGIIRVAGYGPYGLNGNVDPTWKAFAPRLGVAYQVTPKTVVRLGYGRSFDIGVFGSNFGHAVTQNLPVLVNQDVRAGSNLAASAIASGLGAYPAGVTPNNTFYPAFTLAQGPPVYTFPPIPDNGVLPLGGPTGNVQPRIRPSFQRLPTLDAWNLTIQHQLTNSMSLEVAYVGNKGTHVFAGNGPAYDANQVAYAPGTGKMAGTITVGGVTSAAPAGTSCTATGVKCSIAFTSTVPNQDSRRPFFNKFSIPYKDPVTGVTSNVVCCAGGIMGNYFGNDASSNYNALQIKLDKRFTQGLQFQANFTWGKAFNYSADNGFLYSVAPRSSYGPDDFNRDKVFIFNGTYELPFGKGKKFASGVSTPVNYIIGGWQITDTLNIASGLPWTPNAAECNTDTGPCLPNNAGGFSVGAGDLDPITHTVKYFTPVASLLSPYKVGDSTCTLTAVGGWSLGPCGGFGLAGRNSMRGPGGWKDDLSVMKSIPITERFRAQFRMDAFNVFNHPVYGFSAQDYGATGGTAIDGTGTNGLIKDIENGTSMRQLTFAIRLFF